MINIFTEHITTRLIYVLNFCFKSKGEDYRLFTNEKEWASVEKKHISYGANPLAASLHIPAQGLLYENKFYPNKIVSLLDGQLAIDGVIDNFSVFFFFLSRYEEYEAIHVDKHNRFLSASNSLVKLGIQAKPILDLMVKAIWDKLQLNYEKVSCNFNVKPSFDIDVAWAYKHRSMLRKVGGLLKRGKPIERINVLLGAKKDPYDTYDLIEAIGKKFPNNLRTFILLGDWGTYDKNIKWENQAYQNLIKRLRMVGEVGIHPSYNSYLNSEQKKIEIKRLSTILNAEIKSSRQHFLRLKIPQTYTDLIQLGITTDYSLGFADQIGFRAGTSFSYPYFDIQRNEITPLTLVPFCYMDSAFKDYLKWSPQQAMLTIEKLVEYIYQVGGTCCFIWHNSSITDTGEWKGWRKVLEFTVEKTIKK